MQALKEVKPVTVPRSALAIGAMPHVTERYQFISTADTIAQIEAMGYQLRSATEAKVRKEERKGFQKHLLRFRLPDNQTDMELFKNQQEFPEIVIINSHDGAHSMRIMAGFFRMACANGLISGSISDEMKIRHVVKLNHDPKKELEETLRIVAGKAKNLSNVVANWKRIKLSEDQRDVLVMATLQARLAGTKHEGHMIQAPEEALLRPVRQSDTGNDLWTTFNILQEKAIKSPIQIKLDDGNTVMLRTTKALDRIVDINKALWHAAETVAA